MKRLITTIILLTAITSSAQTGAISVNFSAPGGGQPSNKLNPNERVGVYPSRYWNNIISNLNNNNATTTLTLRNDSGQTTTTNITYPQNFWSINNGSTPAGRLSSGYINTYGASNSVITLSQIGSEFTGSGYSVIIYLGGTDTQTPGTAIEVGASVNGGASQWIRHVRSEDGAVAEFDSHVFPNEDSAENSKTNSNHIIFKGLHADSVKISILKDPDSTDQWHRASVKGIQIVKNLDSPSSALIGIGGITLSLTNIR